MATNKNTPKKSKSKNDMDFGDLDDLGDLEMDFDIDSELGSDDREPSRTGVAKKLAREAGEGFMESLIKETTKRSLPEEYTTNYYAAVDLADFGRNVFEENKQRINKSGYRFAKEVKKALPFKVGLLDKYIEKVSGDFEEQRQQSEAEMRTASIQSELSSIFDKQLEVTKAIEAQGQAREEVERKENIGQQKLMLDVLSRLDNNVANQTAFTLQITREYYRKSLEVQFKSYFVQADTLREIRDNFKAFSIQFSSIEKNTSLPEFVKLKNTERFQDLMRDNLTQTVYKELFSNSKYLSNIKKKMGNMVSEKINSFTDSVDEMTDMLSMVNDGTGGGMGTLNTMASIASSMFGSTLGEKISEKLSPKIKAKIKDNKLINTGANYLNILGTSPSSFFQTMREKAAKAEQGYEDESSPGRWMMSKMLGGARGLLETTTEDPLKADIKQLGYLDHKEPAIFDNRVHRSITEEIPMYLARILQKNTDLTSMFAKVNGVDSPNSGLLMYDFGERKLSDEETIRDNIQKKVFSDKSGFSRSKTTGAVILDKAKKNVKNMDLNSVEKLRMERLLGDKKGQASLTNYLEKARKDHNVDYSYEGLFVNYKENQTLQSLVDKDPKLKNMLEALESQKSLDKHDINTRLKDLQQEYPIEAVKRLFSESSKLAGRQIVTQISDKTANVFAKAFSAFILRRSQDVSPTNIADGTAFMFIKKAQADDKTKDAIAVLLADVSSILRGDDQLLDTSLNLLTALMSTALKSNIDIDPAAYQSLAEMYPSMVKTGKLSIEQLAEGKFSEKGDQDYMPYEEVMAMRKVGNQELQEKRVSTVIDRFIDRSVTSISQATSAAAQAVKATNGNPAAIAELAVASVRNIKSSVTETANKSIKKLSDQFGEIEKRFNTVAPQTVASTVNWMTEKTANIINTIDETIALKEREIEERAMSLERVSQEVGTVLNSEVAEKAMVMSLRAYNAGSQASVNGLREFRKVMVRQHERLSEAKTLQTGDAKKLLVTTGKVLRESVEKTRSVITRIEEEMNSTTVPNLNL